MYNQPVTSRTSTPSGGNKPGNRKPAQGPKKKRNLILPLLLVFMGCAVFAFAAWSAVTSPVLASIISGPVTPQFEQRAPGESFAQVYIAKPTNAPVAVQPAAQEAQPTTVVIPTAQDAAVVPSTDAPTLAPPAEVAVVPTATTEAVAVVETGQAVAEVAIVPDTPTAEYVAPPTAVANVPPASTGGNGGAHWFDVDLSDQRMYAYEGDTLVNTFVVSTGTWQTPTVTGKFKVWVKLRSAPMSGPGYYLPDVPYIMYFYGDYGIHGTYWHNNFGVPMSHGCVNLSIPDAEWAYNFASVGTVVNVHD